MLSAKVMTDKIILRDTFLTDIGRATKRVIAQIILCVLCFLGFSVMLLIATRIMLLVFLFVCVLMDYVPPIPFLTG